MEFTIAAARRTTCTFLMRVKRWRVHGAHFGLAPASRSGFRRRAKRKCMLGGQDVREGTYRCDEAVEGQSGLLLQVPSVGHDWLQAWGQISSVYRIDRKLAAKDDMQGAVSVNARRQTGRDAIGRGGQPMP